MGRDVAAALAGSISNAKTSGSSDNIRHGRYRFEIVKICAELVEGQTDRNFGFWNVRPLTSAPNPQAEGDRVDYVSLTSPGTGPLKDDGNNPNLVGSDCGMKLDFTTNEKVAASNMKAAIIALFNMPGDVSDEEVFETWMELSLQRHIKKGEFFYAHPKTGQPVFATRDLIPNPACGMIIDCTTRAQKKRTANAKGAYVTALQWRCAFPIGQGENAMDKVAARRAEIERSVAAAEEVEATAPAAPPVAAPSAPVAPPLPTPAAPPAPPVAFVPPAGWQPHPDPVGGKGWYYKGTEVKSEAQLRSGQ